MAVDCLVINLTRFGDLLQTQPLLHSLDHSGLRIGLICQENFANALPLLAHVSKAWALPGAALLRDLEENWQLSYARLRSFAEDIWQEAQDALVLNLTATVPARLLTKLLAKSLEQQVGFALDPFGFGINRGAWATLASGTTFCRENAVFNMADMFRKMAAPILDKLPPPKTKPTSSGLNPPEAKALAHLKKILEESNLPIEACPPAGFLAFQLGASVEARQWPVKYFARLGDLIYKKAKLIPILTGSKAEAHLALEYANCAQSPFLSLIGQTNLEELAALLTQVKLLVSNDTGTLHLAAGLGTKSVSFFLATAQPFDTAPYLSNCLCLEPDLPCHPCRFRAPCSQSFKCREIIKPEPVAQIILNYLQQESWPRAITEVSDLQARVYETAFDEAGLACVHPLSARKSDRLLWIAKQRTFWCQVLDEKAKKQNATADQEPALLSEDFRQKIKNSLSQVCQLLQTLSEQSLLLGKTKEAGQLFLRNCHRLETILTSQGPLSSFGFYWKELRSDHGGDLLSLKREIGNFRLHLLEMLGKL